MATGELLLSRSRALAMPWWERVDPYYLDQRIQISWIEKGRATRRRITVAPGQQENAETWKPEFEELPTTVLARRYGLLSTLSFMLSWKVATTDQVATALGRPARDARAHLHQLFSWGILYQGSVAYTQRNSRLPYVWRLRTSGKETRRLLEILDDDTWRHVTGGAPLRALAHDRHDLLATELGLRTLEVIKDLQAVHGEAFGGVEQLFPGEQPGGRGDLVIVRDDGLRIVIELTRVHNAAVREKMARWARVLARQGPLAESGTVVVFVAVAPRPTGSSATLAALRRTHVAALTAETTGISDPLALRAARASILVADWEQWFPAPWLISDDFARLASEYRVEGDSWHPVDVAHGDEGGMPFRPRDPEHWHGPRLRRRAGVFYVPGFVAGPLRLKLEEWIGDKPGDELRMAAARKAMELARRGDAEIRQAALELVRGERSAQ